MQNLQRLLSRISISPSARKFESISIPGKEFFSTDSGGGSRGDGWKEWDSVDSSGSGGGGGSGFGFDSVESWSTGLTELDFEGKEGGLQVAPPRGSTGGIVSKRQSVPMVDDVEADIAALEEHNREFSEYVNSWPERMKEVNMLLKQVNEPGVRGSYLKDSEKAEMYKLHKENPTVYTIEKLAKDYRIMRQRVHAILWLKEEEEKEEKELGYPLDDSVELLLDTCPEFFNSHDREFHVATLPYKPDFKIMPEGWDGTTRDLDEVHYEISQKEDEMLYQEFVQRMNFNKKKMAGEVKVHKYSRRRSDEGWNFTVEKLGPRGKRGGGGGWKFVSLPDGSSRPLNEMERMYVKRETVKRRRKIVP